MSIKYNGKIVAGNYKAQVVSDADTINKGILRIATQDEVNEALSNDTAVTPYYLSYKQNKLTSGKNISIQNDTINCNIMPDSSTIVQNDDNTFTSIGQKTPTNTIKIDWEGTSAEYEAGIENGTIKADWFCYITDDEQMVEFDNTTDKYDLEASNIYTLGKYTMTDIEGYDILEAEYLNPNSIKKIDILLEDNFTTVGIPVITEDRILNQTSENNYIYIDDLNFDNKDFYINTKLEPNKDITTNNILYIKSKSRENYIQCNIENNNIYIKAFDGVSELNSEVIELQLNIYYNIQVGFASDKNQLYLKVFDINGVLLKIVSIQLNSYGAFFGEDSVTLYIGYDLQNYLNNISVDLNSFKVYVEETCVYRVCLRMPYIYSAQNSKIVDYKYKDRILDWIGLNNSSEYYIINTEDKTFVLPNIQNPLSKIIYSSDRSLNNLTEEGEKHFINKSQITNCLLEVPQNIKLELNNGTLTLKAGSTPIFPNGDDVFEYKTTTNDIIIAPTGGSGQVIISIKYDLTSGQATAKGYSGDNVTPTTYSLCYDTAINLVHRYSSNTTAGVKSSLPIAICTQTDGVLTSIDQVFNGFGYIGSTIWADKGVKGLNSNGRNEDGTLNNIEYTTDKLSLRTFTDGFTNSYYLYYALGTKIFSVSSTSEYNKETNFSRYGIEIGTLRLDSDVITNFQTKQPFGIIDNAVSKSGDTMTGVLRLNVDKQYSDPVQLVCPEMDWSTAPSRNTNCGIHFYDKTGKLGPYFILVQNTGSAGNYFSIGHNATNDPNFLGFNFPKASSKATTSSSASVYKPAVVTQNYVSGTSWYRVWSDGWIEQGGVVASGSASNTVTLAKSFSNKNYSVQATLHKTASTANYSPVINITANNTFIIYSDSGGAQGCKKQWYACGY